MPPEGGGGEDIPRGAEKCAWHYNRASLIASWYGVPPVHRSPRCAWGWGVAWDAGLPHKTLLQPPNAGTAEPFRVSPPEAVAYPLESMGRRASSREHSPKGLDHGIGHPSSLWVRP